jgi:hypothetical protein
VLRRVAVQLGAPRDSHPTYDLVVTTVEAATPSSSSSSSRRGESNGATHGFDGLGNAEVGALKCVARARRGLRFQAFRDLHDALEAFSADADLSKATRRPPLHGSASSCSILSPPHPPSLSDQLLSKLKDLLDDAPPARNSATDPATDGSLAAWAAAAVPFPKTHLKSVFGVNLTRDEVDERRRDLQAWLSSVEARAAALPPAQANAYEAFLAGPDGGALGPRRA